MQRGAFLASFFCPVHLGGGSSLFVDVVRWSDQACAQCDGHPTLGGRVGGWVRGQNKVCVPEVCLQFRACSISFLFLMRKSLLIRLWGGSVGFAPNDPPPFSPSRVDTRVQPASDTMEYDG